MTMVPQELATEILSCLPVKSLLRFKCACSSWYNLINSPFFVNLHLTTAVAALKVRGINNYTILTESTTNPDPPSLSLVSGDTFHVIREVTLPPFFGKSGFSFSGPCNGLFCLIGKTHRRPDNGNDFYSDDIVLWNPATRKLDILPHSPSPGVEYSVVSFGFGAISSSDSDSDYDYKVVKIVRVNTAKYHAYVYSSKKNCWTEAIVPPTGVGALLSYIDCCCYHNGSYYWLILQGRNFLLSFDMHSHVFHISLFHFACHVDRWMVNFEVQNDSLVILVYRSTEGLPAETCTVYDHHHVGLPSLKWYENLVRNEVLETWSHHARVGDYYSSMHSSVCINDEYNLKSPERKVYYVNETRGESFSIVPFVESLVSADTGESLSENNR